MLCSEHGQYTKAELLLLEGLAIREKALEHPAVATSLENYALCL